MEFQSSFRLHYADTFKYYNRDDVNILVDLLEKAHLTTLLWLTSVSLELSAEDQSSEVQGLSQLEMKESYSSYSLKNSM